MKTNLFLTAAAAAFVLSACGYKGDLYLPKENDKARFGVIQTGLPALKNTGRTVNPQSGEYEAVPTQPVTQNEK